MICWFSVILLLERAQKIVSLLFPQESLYGDAGHCVQSYDSLTRTNSPLRIIKSMTALDKIVSTELINEECIETVHVLMCETHWFQFL